MNKRSMLVILLVAVAGGCVTTTYVVEPAPLAEARARGDRHALVPAQVLGSGAPVFVEAGAVRLDAVGHGRIINRTVLTGDILLGVGAMHLIPGILLMASDSGCQGSDACGFGTFAGGIVTAFGGIFFVTGAILAIVGSSVHPHEWRRTAPPRSAHLGPDGALHF